MLVKSVNTRHAPRARLNALCKPAQLAAQPREVVRIGLVGLQGDGLAVGLACFAPVLLSGVPRTFSQQLVVRVARLS